MRWLFSIFSRICVLTHWGRATHICVSKLTIIGSDNGLSPGRRQAITWTNDGILLIGPLGTNFSEILSKIHIFPFKKMHLKTSYAKWRPFCLGLHVLKNAVLIVEMPSNGNILVDILLIGPSGNGSTRHWPPGSRHTFGAGYQPYSTKGLAFKMD